MDCIEGTLEPETCVFFPLVNTKSLSKKLLTLELIANGGFQRFTQVHSSPCSHRIWEPQGLYWFRYFQTWNKQRVIIKKTQEYKLQIAQCLQSFLLTYRQECCRCHIKGKYIGDICTRT